jgi:hypothetical protein
MRSFALLLAFVAVASAAIAPTSPPATECSRYQLTTNTNLQIPSSIPGYIPNVIIYDANALMMGVPEGPYFEVIPSDCYWVPNGAFNCAINLYLDAGLTTYIGYGTLNSTDLAVQGTSTVVGFHFVSGTVQLTTTITSTTFTPPAQSYNFHSLSTSLYFPATVLLPVNNASAPNVANGVSYVGTSEYLTLWGSNGGWNGTTWGASRTTGFDIRASLVCSPASSGHGTGTPCPTCLAGAVTVPSACISSGNTISQTVAGNCISLSFASSTSTSAFNGCSGGSF